MDEFRTVQTDDVNDLAGLLATLNDKEPTVLVAPDGTRAYVLSEAAHERLLDKLEDALDSLACAIAREENEPTRPFDEYVREREAKEMHVPG